MLCYRKEQLRMENILEDLQRRFEEAKRKKDQQMSQLEPIKSDMISKINAVRDILKGPADEYLRTLNQLQNRISKIEAYSCFEDGKLKLVTMHCVLSGY